ncbi:MAG: hypothetical protein NWF05_00905 [Candidatus Bathyarchaeota archaeon]|nr:hypothetical protein [Candidatus Bathyarchaeota archaeon]
MLTIKKPECLKGIKLRSPTLTVKGFVVSCADNANGAVTRKFDWGNALIDAVITSGLTFFSTLGGGTVAGLSCISGVEVAMVAAFTQFFVFLALKRGIVQTKET